jgi:hypothetical protein
MHQLQTAVSSHPLKTGHMFIELIYSEESILPPPKIFTIPPETPCVYTYTCANPHVCKMALL